MSREFTAEQVEQKYVLKMGPELGQLFACLYNETAWLYWKWGEYVGLFGTSEQRVNLLNKASGRFAKMLQDVLFEDTLLHIARLPTSLVIGEPRRSSCGSCHMARTSRPPRLSSAPLLLADR